MDNPFRFDRLPSEAAFVDRLAEVDRIVSSIKGGENLLVHGDRRIGKTSCLLRAARRAAREFDATCFFADLSRYSSLADVTEALLRNAIPKLSSLGGKTAQWLTNAVRGLILKPGVKAAVDAKSIGGPEMEVSLGVELRARDRAAQVTALIEVLDALDQLAGQRRRKVGVILDEFTFLEKIGPERASWQLRSAIQHHQNLTYILAGSAEHLIAEMHGPDGAFYGMFGRLSVGPIPSGELAAWIDGNFSREGIKPEGIGQDCCRLAGIRTRDVVQLARRAFDLAAADRSAGPDTARAAFDSLIEDFDPGFQSAWSQFTSSGQAILLAVAAGQGSRLFSEPIRQQFGLGSTASVSLASRRLARTARNSQDFRDAVLVRTVSKEGLSFTFDSPFFATWVQSLQRRIAL